jgi:hypothetical protein
LLGTMLHQIHQLLMIKLVWLISAWRIPTKSQEIMITIIHLLV